MHGSFVKLGFLEREVVLTARGGGLVQHGPFSRTADDVWKPAERTGTGLDEIVFEAAGSNPPRRLAFRTGPSGELRYLCLEADAFTVLDAFERLAWDEGSLVQAIAAGVCLLVFACALVVPAWRRLRGGAFIEDTAAGHLARRLAVAASAAFLLFVLGMAAALLALDPYAFAFGTPPAILALLALPPAAAACAALLLTALLMALKDGGARVWPGRAGAAAVAACSLLFLVLLAYWRLLGYHG